MIVATAAPATPMWKTKMKIGSSTILTHGSDQYGEHGGPGLALGADKSIEAYSQLHEDCAEKINADVGRGIADRIVTGPEYIEQRLLEHEEKRHQNHGKK